MPQTSKALTALKRCRVATGLAAALLFAACAGAHAAEHVYDLKTTTAGYWTQTANIGGGLTQYFQNWNLVDVATGSDTGAGYLLAPGDVIRGSIQFDHVWTPPNLAAPGMPDWFTFQLGDFAGTAYPVNDQVAIDYYLGGVLVALSNPALGGFGNRVGAAPDYNAVVPAAAFDSISFRIDVADVYDNAQASFGVPTQVDGFNGQLMVFEFAPQAVPEPGSWSLVLVALGALGASVLAGGGAAGTPRRWSSRC
jgi:hypothetical protein